MSATVMYIFKRDGNALFLDEVENSHRGAMVVWRILEAKYLPSLPSYYRSNTSYNSRLITGTEEQLKEFWQLIDSDKLSDEEKLILATTYDNVVLLKKDFKLVIDAYNAFSGNTSLKEQASIIEKVLHDDDVIALAWNQSDIGSCIWSVWSDDEDVEEPTPYNLFNNNKHTIIYDDGSLNVITN